MSKIIKHTGNSIDFSTPIVMGILNLTTDSFYDGGLYLEEDKIIRRIIQIEKLGAKIIDLGASSSRPGSIPVSEDEEIKKLLPTIEIIKKHSNKLLISIDTFRSNVAKICIEKGADIINDISAGNKDKEMFNTVIELDVPYIMMHMQGNSLTMQNNPRYKNIILELLEFFEKKIKNLEKKGFNKIIIDPGFGFGKTLDHNYEILKNLSKFKKFGYPLLIGASRKSMIYNLLNKTPQEVLNGTSIVNTISLLNGADILRVHDIEEALECIRITNQIK
ncbi:MAG: dihydropteroate synthase [Flavobacteriales bacterium]|nr:dihydropteroate synthase [Flavobacteriales bacterium]